MSQLLPVDDFKWLNDEEIEELTLNDISKDCPRGYIYECDLGKLFLFFFFLILFQATFQ